MPRLKILVLALAVSLISPLPLNASSGPPGSEDRAGGEGAAPAVTTFTVKPMQRPPAILMPDVTPPPPLADEEKQNALRAIGGSPASVNEGAGFVLSAATPWVEDKGYLVLTGAQTVHPESAIEFGPDGGGVLGVKLNVVKGGLYLVEFAVSAVGPGTYRVSADSEGQDFEDPHAKSRHLLIGLRAETDGWTNVRLQRTGAGYKLHSVEITSVNP